MKRIKAFLWDRLGLILLVLGNSLLVMTWFSLWVVGEGFDFLRLGPVWIYGGGITLSFLIFFLLIDWLRWLPVKRSLHKIADGEEASLPKGPLRIQRLIHDAIQSLERARLAERHQAQAEKRRHLDFMNQWVHQMKTPVSVLSLLAQQSDEVFAREMEEELDKLNQGLEMILHMARLEEFALDFHLQKMNLKEEVNRILGERKRQWIRQRIYPRWEEDQEGSWEVYTDSKWNRFVLDQIFNNAIKYASQVCDTQQYLHLSLRRKGKWVCLTIRDEGPGIPAQDVPRVFDPFFTGENGRRFKESTGIGLYLVKQVLTSMDHQIEIRSTEGMGTSVTLFYPGITRGEKERERIC